MDQCGIGIWRELRIKKRAFSLVSELSFPLFDGYSSLMTNGTATNILTTVKSSPDFPDTKRILRIDPVAKATKFLLVENYPFASGSHFYESRPALYTPEMNRIYCFGGYSEHRVEME